MSAPRERSDAELLYQLQHDLAGQCAYLRNLATMIRKHPERVDPEAVAERLERQALWAQVYSFSARRAHEPEKQALAELAANVNVEQRPLYRPPSV